LGASSVDEVKVTISVEDAIRSSIQPGEVLPTPTGTATFVVDQLDTDGLSLLFGPKKTRTTVSWRCLEGIPAYLRGRGWVAVGANRDLDNDRGLDGYLKRWIKRQTANYVAVVLERAGVLDLDRQRPARIRLSNQWS
jgi:hypothetical protein